MQESTFARRKFLKDGGLAVAGPAVALSVFPAARQTKAETAAISAAVQSGRLELELLNPSGVIDPPKIQSEQTVAAAEEKQKEPL